MEHEQVTIKNNLQTPRTTEGSSNGNEFVRKIEVNNLKRYSYDECINQIGGFGRY